MQVYKPEILTSIVPIHHSTTLWQWQITVPNLIDINLTLHSAVLRQQSINVLILQPKLHVVETEH
jgi:hypothetical protein